MKLVIEVNDRGILIAAEEKKHRLPLGGSHQRGGLLKLLASRRVKQACGRTLDGIVLYFRGGTFSEARSAAAIAYAWAWVRGVPVRVRGPLYAAEPFALKKVEKKA